jgi:hypothetical protein
LQNVTMASLTDDSALPRHGNPRQIIGLPGSHYIF